MFSMSKSYTKFNINVNVFVKNAEVSYVLITKDVH